MGYIFEWDSRKAASNLKKHGVSFDEATTAFCDPLSLLMDDPKHSEDEQRFLVMGLSVQHRLLVVSFAERPPRTRIISARLAARHERKQYEQE
ncbi:MAG: BrnT family toxin [Gallionella sp.]|nr:BrnT family toxin [Gallionella sp.]